MSLPVLQALSPLIVLAVAAVVTMLVIGFQRNLALTALLAAAGVAASLAVLPWALAAEVPVPLFSLDRYAYLYMGLLFAASLAVVVLSYGYMSRRSGEREEFFVLLLLAALGAGTIVASSHFVSFFLGLEILSVSLYTMIAYARLREWSLEAGMKYLILASTSAAVLLMGIALIYAETGMLDFASIAAEATRYGMTHLALAGTVLLVVGIGFKLAIVPFHMWTPDVYEGAPAPVTAFVATVSKGALLAVLLRYFAPQGSSQQGGIFLVWVVMAIASMLAGNLLALWQSNVKRILAYSSIAHLGYILVAFLAGGAAAIASISFYLAAYFATTLAAFGVVAVLSGPEHDVDGVEDYRGLGRRRPYLGAVFALALLSLAGIPVTGGFIGKFLIAMAGVGSSLWLLVAALALGSAISLFYYLRLVALVFAAPVSAEIIETPSLNRASAALLGLLAAVVVWLGVYPGPLLTLVAAATLR